MKTLNYLAIGCVCLIIIMFAVLMSRGSNPQAVTVEVTYLNGDKEILETTFYMGCSNRSRLEAGCTYCLVDTRCGVRSVRVISEKE